MAIMLNARSNVYENISFSASQPSDSSTILQLAGIAVHYLIPTPLGRWLPPNGRAPSDAHPRPAPPRRARTRAVDGPHDPKAGTPVSAKRTPARTGRGATPRPGRPKRPARLGHPAGGAPTAASTNGAPTTAQTNGARRQPAAGGRVGTGIGRRRARPGAQGSDRRPGRHRLSKGGRCAATAARVSVQGLVDCRVYGICGKPAISGRLPRSVVRFERDWSSCFTKRRVAEVMPALPERRRPNDNSASRCPGPGRFVSVKMNHRMLVSAPGGLHATVPMGYRSDVGLRPLDTRAGGAPTRRRAVRRHGTGPAALSPPSRAGP